MIKKNFKNGRQLEITVLKSTASNITQADVHEETLEESDGERAAMVDGIVIQHIPVIQLYRESGKSKDGIIKTISTSSKALTDILTQSVLFRRDDMTSDKHGNKAFLTPLFH